ncbi:WxL domain-containing protein [Companilactobacillus allii]|uniref:WxL domain-containing protein n=1 Tax=Companilactobacillus allii TaxID=1847728 RepID=A0A1P8Q0E6_9LACO|nr:WxL domain-containing protein [Companilactobacillus allii]APX71295.1 hypothetical protein BTM29_01445 [Companilactobacillus allii]USQ68377.1 WxL domain-containing protein [Companilactobacillus allii]
MKLHNCVYATVAALSTFLMFTSVAKAETTDNVTSLNDSDNIAINYNSDDNNSETTTKTSTVSVNVLSGDLSLDAVPSFSFEKIEAGSSVNLKDNSSDGDVVVDGNSSGILQVTDSRKNSPGFILSARLNSFSNNNSNDNFTMTLNSQELYDDSGDNISTSSDDLTTEKAKLDAGSNQNTEVMNLNSGSYRSGTITTSFTSPDSASLYTPSNASDLNSSSRHSSTIVWTLTPKPSTTE